ncbi:8775_t:CDS:2, partial [Cetraspora pellucida]
MKKDAKSSSLGWKTKGHIPISLTPHGDHKIIKEAKFCKGMMLGYRLFPYAKKLSEDIYQLPNIHTHSCGELTYEGGNEKGVEGNGMQKVKFIDGNGTQKVKFIDGNGNEEIYLENDDDDLIYNRHNYNDDVYNEYIDNSNQNINEDFDNISQYSLSDSEDVPQTPGSVSYPINIINNRNDDEILESPNSNPTTCNEIEFIYLTTPKESLLELMDSLDRLADNDIRSGSSPGFGIDSTLKGVFYKIIKVEDKVGFEYKRRSTV